MKKSSSEPKTKRNYLGQFKKKNAAYYVGTRIVQLEIVYQRDATKKEIAADSVRAKDMQGLVGIHRKLVSYREFVDCDIPVGPEHNGNDKLKRLIIRAVVYHLEPHYTMFYCVAHFRSADGKDEFARTVMPRTEISPRLREMRG